MFVEGMKTSFAKIMTGRSGKTKRTALFKRTVQLKLSRFSSNLIGESSEENKMTVLSE